MMVPRSDALNCVFFAGTSEVTNLLTSAGLEEEV